jgi:Domain of unknown function (DUF397)
MELTKADWHKSTYSGNNGGNCVEIARNLPGVVAIRDSKDCEGPALVVGPSAFAALIDGIRAGEFH